MNFARNINIYRKTHMAKLLLKKSITQLMKEANDPSDDAHGIKLKKHLNGWHLMFLGVGAIVGAGIFSLSGTGAAYYAGPAIVYSFILAGFLCALAGLCYAEMSSMVPLSGSAYTYSYATMGEFVAWIIGWDLVLEYAFGAVTVASAWSGYLYSIIYKTMGIELPTILLRFTKGPWETVTLPDGSGTAAGIVNLPASFVAILAALVLFRGIRESAIINNIIVIIKVTIVIAFIALGWSVIDQANWIGNAAVEGFQSLVPPIGLANKDGREFMSYGWPGVLTGAGVVFFAYIGFDSVSTAAQECKNPQRDLPIGILGSLIICTVLYIAMSLVMTGVVRYSDLGVPDPVAVGIDRIIELRQWDPTSKFVFTLLVKVGALLGLTSVILVLMLGQTRIFYSMARDGLLPWFNTLHPTYHTPSIATVVTGGLVAICAGLMPMSIVGELVSIGTLLAFVVVCLGVSILRVTEPNIPRPFKVPLHWLVGPLGAISCLWVMSGLPPDTWLRLLVWLLIGFIIYFAYGIHNSKLRRR
jgi:APA family basic amino acid/polyamine antiporter